LYGSPSPGEFASAWHIRRRQLGADICELREADASVTFVVGALPLHLGVESA
jgi:hypothetical protein